MKAVMLAGGRGIRLGEVTHETPKPMIPVGDKPLLHHLVELLVSYGIKDITLLVNYRMDPIIQYFEDGSRFGATIDYFKEDIPLGTVGGIKEMEDRLTEDFLVVYGDVMINMDLHRFINFHRQKKSDCTLVLHPNDHPYDSDLVETDLSDRIVAFHPKPHDSTIWYHNLVNAGIYILTPGIFKFLEKGKKADFGREVFPRIFQEMNMFGYRTPEYLKDMGTPDRLEKVRHDFISGKIHRKNLELPQRAVFLDRDGVLNVERSYISHPDELVLYEYTPASVRRLNEAGYLTVVVTNQSAVARNLCTEADVQTIHRKMESLLGAEHAWLDDIHYCPHHPHKGYPDENTAYKIDCDCRKPKTGMFRKAIEKFNIDPAVSFMIGDSERDIQAGINIGCITIGVRSGYGIRKTNLYPDYMFDNLAEAADFIAEDKYQSQFQKAFTLFKAFTGGKPWVVLIGGNARTGKSTLATYFRIAFQKAGHQVLQVGLDNWLLPEADRRDGMNVYERFQLDSIETDISSLLAGNRLVRSTYPQHPEQHPNTLTYTAAGAEVVIIEGVVALSSAILRQAAHLRIFTTAAPATFNRRIQAYYRWRNKTDAEIAHLVHKRESDEYRLIEKESNLADLIINSSGS